ncbi:MAG: GspMb/PilO family protein [Phycisphaerales bacterium]
MDGSKRMKVLAGAVLVLLALVVADRYGAIDAVRGMFGGGGASTDAVRVEASLLARQRALVESSEDWERAERESERAWGDVRSGVVRADTRALAEAQLRERVLSVVSTAGVRSVQAVGVATPGSPATRNAEPTPNARAGLASVERIRLRVSFDAPEHPNAVEALERLAEMASPRIRMESLTMNGPGERQAGGGAVAVTVELEAVALVGRESGASPVAAVGRTGADGGRG